MKNLLIVVGSLVLTLAFGIALQAEEPAPAPAEKKALEGDTNGDGKLSRAEFDELLVDKTMKQMDTNGDGSISKEEAAALPKADPKIQDPAPRDQATVAASQADGNKDGKISREELKKALEKDKTVTTFFEDRDKDRDGFMQPYDRTETMTTIGVRIKF